MLLSGSLVISQSLKGDQHLELALHAFRMRSTLKHVDLGTAYMDRIDHLRVFAPLNEDDIVQSRVLSKNEVDAFRIKHTLR